MTEIVFKVARAAEWETARATGVYRGSTDDLRGGFIHLSSASQLPGTLRKHFKGARDLILIAFEAGALAQSLKWESSRNGEAFPHLYAPLPVAKALWSRPIGCDDEGNPQIDEAQLTC